MTTRGIPSDGSVHLNTAPGRTVIIGAGPAGLAVGACLNQAGIPHVILEQAESVGSAWRGHYDRLHLHTSKAFSRLPFFPFPKDYPRYPSRLQVIAYLEAYARQFHLEPRFGQKVISARHSNGSWEVKTQDNRYEADNLVIAAGYNREPHLPHWPGEELFRGPILHSSKYKNGEPYKSRKVLVVGFGNSGGEIAVDLLEHGAQPGLAVRSPVNVIPRELLGIPILAVAALENKLPPRWADALNAPILWAAVGDLTRYGLRRLPHGPLRQILSDARVPLIDVGTIRLIKRGQISVYPGIERFNEDGVLFTDGRQEKFNAVVLATGYRPRVDAFLEEASVCCDENGTPLASGREMPLPGLYFCGYYVSPTGMLREIAAEARRICSAIARNRTRAAAAQAGTP